MLVMSFYLITLRNKDEYQGHGDSTEQGIAEGSLDLNKEKGEFSVNKLEFVFQREVFLLLYHGFENRYGKHHVCSTSLHLFFALN